MELSWFARSNCRVIRLMEKWGMLCIKGSDPILTGWRLVPMGGSKTDRCPGSVSGRCQRTPVIYICFSIRLVVGIMPSGEDRREVFRSRESENQFGRILWINKT